jgi:hypothetical protein
MVATRLDPACPAGPSFRSGPVNASARSLGRIGRIEVAVVVA